MKKLLVANRSEIAIRVFRAATELGLTTVAVYTSEDRFALHRFKADESYQVGPADGGAPVKGYLDIDSIVSVAKAHGVDAIHPGYGFLSENAAFARACKAAGITFVGPTPDMLDTFGDKTAAKALAKKAGVQTVPGTDRALTKPAEIRAAAEKIGFPLIIKASFGGGGRGMRVVTQAEELLPKLEEAQREAGAAFGRPEVFLERFIRRAKHIEVQIVGDSHGNLVHLWERDCSVQRRHQKVVEIAPSINLPRELREAICESAVKLMSTASYLNAGTVEFLVDSDTGEFYFIEVNPRVQVEHTVTEVVTGIDIVKTQILIAQGMDLHSPAIGIPAQHLIEPRGYAIQCRITTEDPADNFLPDYGRLTTYRSPAGFGIRLDGGSAYGGAVITPYFDSLLVKLTASGNTFDEAIRRTDRALREFRIRGVKTNIPFLENLIHHPRFATGDTTTTFIDNSPELFRFKEKRDRATKLLKYLGDVIVNGRPDVAARLDVKRLLPVPLVPAPAPGAPPFAAAPPPGTRQLLRELGPERFCQWVMRQKRLMVTDTTMRDGHQSLLATRVRTIDLAAPARATAHLASGLFSLECWGGATFDTAMRFLQEDPWERLRELRARVPNLLLQMLLRSSNAVGYTHYPDNVVRRFIRHSGATGIDVFRVFDSLNRLEAMQASIEAVREETIGLCEAAVCYTGDLLNPHRTKYSLKYYVTKAKALKKMGTHLIGIKDMAGLCRPFAAEALVRAIRSETGLPVHFHTHDTSGFNAATLIKAAEAGVDIVDAALAPFSGTTSQPNLNSLVAALEHTPRDTGLNLDGLNRLARYWEQVRQLYYPFEEGLLTGTAEVYQHEMPGGQFTNLRQQAKSLGLEDRWQEVGSAYAAVNQMLGDIVKVTPSSKVVGDMAIFMVTSGLTVHDIFSGERRVNFPKSLVEMMQGAIGTPDGGWPRKFQQIVLKSAGVKPVSGKPKRVDFKAASVALTVRLKRQPTEDELQSHLMYPQVFLDYHKARGEFDNVAALPTSAFFYGLKPGEETTVTIDAGKALIIKYLTTSALRDDGTRIVFFELNGQPREVVVTAKAVAAVGAAAAKAGHPKAEPDNPRHVAAPMPGKVSAVTVNPGDPVKAGQRLLSIEAMKMESSVYSPSDGKVAEVLVKPGQIVSAKDLLVVLS